MKKVKDKPNILHEIIKEQEVKKLMEEQVSEAVIEMHKKNEYFNSVKYIQERLQEELGL